MDKPTTESRYVYDIPENWMRQIQCKLEDVTSAHRPTASHNNQTDTDRQLITQITHIHTDRQLVTMIRQTQTDS